MRIPALAASIILALAALSPCLAEPSPAGLGPAAALGPDTEKPDQVFSSGRDFVLYPPDRGPSFFRFLPDGPSLPFDRSIRLCAAQGEERSYLIQVGGGADLSDALKSLYSVDKRRPRSPTASPSAGLYNVRIEIALAAEDGASIQWSLAGPAGLPSDFATYGPASKPVLLPPASGSASYTVVAYAIDDAGNRSYPSTFTYRLAEAGLPAAAPAPSAAGLVADSSLPSPLIEAGRGFSELRMTLPEGASLLVDFDAHSAPSSLDDFERIEPEGGTAKLRIPCPYAWSGDIDIYYGMVKGGQASFAPKPIKVHLTYPADDQPLPAVPPDPVLAADPSGRGSFIAFPSYDGDIYASIGSGKPQLYSAPIALPIDQTSARVSWYGEDSGGLRSAARSLSFALPEFVPDLELQGVADGAVLGGDAQLKPALRPVSANSATALRYELRLDGSLPQEPGPASPLVGDSLSIPCPSGAELSVVLRYKSFSGAQASEGRILRFTLDRKPPEAPRFSEAPGSYSDKAAKLELQPGSGGRDVFASISADGIQSPFMQVSGPLVLPGSESGPVSYLIRAYDTDAAGNRSQEMKSLALVVDRTSVYVADDGSDKGDGSPNRPYRSLDYAIALAGREGKKTLNLRGVLDMRSPVSFASELALVGGFGPAWNRDGSARAIVRISPNQGRSAFSQEGGSLSLRRVELRADSAGPWPLISLSGASLVIEASSIVAGTDGDLILVSATKSRIALSGSTISATKAMAFTAFSAERCSVAVSECSISAGEGVRIFGAFDMDGGDLALLASLIESRSDLGLSLFSLRSSSLLVDRCLIGASGGSGFLRVGAFKSVTGEIRNSKLLLSWKGPGTLFESSGAGPDFRHDTMVADTSAGLLRFFDATGRIPQIWNSILDCSSGGAELLRCDSAPAAGAIVADCLWGFGRLVTGGRELAELESLNALNASSGLYSSKPNIGESPERTFAAPLKSQAPLRRGSACVDAAMPLDSPGYELDFSGKKRPAGSAKAPDIGADELSD